jgi:hypothetical protein
MEYVLGLVEILRRVKRYIEEGREKTNTGGRPQGREIDRESGTE